MKHFLKPISLMLALLLIFPLLSSAASALDTLPDGYVAVENEDGTVYYEDGNRQPDGPLSRGGDELEWVYFFEGDDMYKRLRNHTRGRWETDWILVCP